MKSDLESSKGKGVSDSGPDARAPGLGSSVAGNCDSSVMGENNSNTYF